MLTLSVLGGAASLALAGASLSGGVLAAAVVLGLVAALACLLPAGLASPMRAAALALVLSAGAGF